MQRPRTLKGRAYLFCQLARHVGHLPRLLPHRACLLLARGVQLRVRRIEHATLQHDGSLGQLARELLDILVLFMGAVYFVFRSHPVL